MRPTMPDHRDSEPLTPRKGQAQQTLPARVCGGLWWWAHLAFTRINIAPTILRKKIEDLREARAVDVDRDLGSRNCISASGSSS